MIQRELSFAYFVVLFAGQVLVLPRGTSGTSDEDSIWRKRNKSGLNNKPITSQKLPMMVKQQVKQKRLARKFQSDGKHHGKH